MKNVSIFFFTLAIFVNFIGCNEDFDKGQTYDIVVYGGTSAGVTAALQAARMQKSVILVCPENHLGGMTTSGLGWTDSGEKKAIGGIAREFYQRLKRSLRKFVKGSFFLDCVMMALSVK